MGRQHTAVLGGTFDRLHVGHEALVRTAFRAADSVAIGLTTDQYLRRHPKPGSRRIQSYATRRRTLVGWLRREFPRRAWRVEPLADARGHSVEPGFDAIVITEETLTGARRVNAERHRRGLPALRIVVAPMVLGDDLLPVSSRRIRAGAIDRVGRRRSAIRITVLLPRPDSLTPWRRAVRRIFPRARVVRASSRARPADLELRIRYPTGRRRGTIAVRAATTRLRPRPFPRGALPDAAVRLVWPSRALRLPAPARKA